jgi:peptidyl-prolyl cis-trans isomerase C
MERDASRTRLQQRGFQSRLLREPLLHFLIAGALIFVVYKELNAHLGGAETTTQITVTKDDVFQLTKAMLVDGTPPTKEQMNALIEQRVNEEILFREALALGLHKNDDVIRRRVADKMEFLIGDMTGLKEPSTSELKALFAKNPDRFAIPPRVSFRQLHFSVDNPNARDRALAALEKITSSSSNATALIADADPCKSQDAYTERTPGEIAKEYGLYFAKAVLQLSPGTWQGPVWSEHGWHLVFVRSIEAGRVPTFEEVESKVKSAWLDEKQREIKRMALQNMRTRYTVTAPLFDAFDWGKLRAQAIFLD